MTPEETIKILEQKKEYSERIIDNFLSHSRGEIKDANETIEMCDMAISALKEVQQYREIGTVEEIKKAKACIKLLRRIKTLEGIMVECLEYERIGTLEECREAVEKQKPKKIIIRDWNPTKCPTCGHELSTSLGDGYYKHPTFLKRFPECGQAIQWDENLENEE